MTDHDDADTLRRALVILQRESTKPKGQWMAILANVIIHAADKLDARGGR